MMCRIAKIGIETDLYWECKKYPIKLMRYKKDGSVESIAELISTDIEISKKKFRVELLSPGANEYVSEGYVLSLRSTPIGESSEK